PAGHRAPEHEYLLSRRGIPDLEFEAPRGGIEDFAATQHPAAVRAPLHVDDGRAVTGQGEFLAGRSDIPYRGLGPAPGQTFAVRTPEDRCVQVSEFIGACPGKPLLARAQIPGGQ